MAYRSASSNSNTTNVKVKQQAELLAVRPWTQYSNTTNVKVKHTKYTVEYFAPPTKFKYNQC